jgi:ferritin-like metal-binding protein YciE
MTKINSLKELFLEELGDLYNAEHQLIKALPKMAEATDSQELRTAIEDHLEQTKNQVNRLEKVFRELGQKPGTVTCKAMKGLIAEGDEVVKKTERGPARDAAIISAAQRVEHYEISGYGTARCHASKLGFSTAEALLSETLEEEKEADTHLNEIAEGSINDQANQNS